LKQKEQEFLIRIEQHKGILHKVSKMYMNDADDQQDLFQEMIYQIWKAYSSFRNESQFSTWMYRVAINTAIVFLKKEKNKIDRHTIPSENIAEEKNDSEQKENQISQFYNAIQQLEKTEKAIIFYHLQGYSHREIGENMGIAEGNARVRLNRIKNKLKEIIEKQHYGL
jgi:RNA polymerase sigma factor (sigma-70 family)